MLSNGLVDLPVSRGDLDEIRSLINGLKERLPASAVSNVLRAEIDADIAQIEAETERPSPRRPFLKMFLESLRDNLAKALGAGSAAALVGGIWCASCEGFRGILIDERALSRFDTRALQNAELFGFALVRRVAKAPPILDARTGS
jgi:hypothetical protein